MPEPIFIRCAVCDETYDKVRSPRCPSCSAQRPSAPPDGRRGESALDRAARQAATSQRTDDRQASQPRSTPSPVARSSASQREDASEAASYGFVLRSPLMVAAGFALGLLVYPMAMNTALGQPLFGAATINVVQPAEVVTLRDRSEEIQRVQVQVKLEERSIELVEWHREPGATDGTLKYVGTVRNTSPAQITKALVQLHAQDLAGRELARGWSWILPSVMEAGEEGTFAVEIEAHSRVQNLKLETAWNQFFKADVADLDPDAASSYFSGRSDGVVGEAPEPSTALVAAQSS